MIPDAEPLLGNGYPEGESLVPPPAIVLETPTPTQLWCFSSSLFVSAVGKVSSMVAHDASSSDAPVGIL